MAKALAKKAAASILGQNGAHTVFAGYHRARRLASRPFTPILRRVERRVGRASDLKPPRRMFCDPEAHCWAGYYDVTPFNRDETKLLAIKTVTPLRSPLPTDKASVGWFSVADSEYRPIGETQAWNWQQGCRLRWVYPDDETELVFYNCVRDDGYGSVLADPDSGEIAARYSTAVYDLAPGGAEGITLNFDRLQRLRPGYGYSVFEDASKDVRAPDDDGVWRVDLKADRRELMYSLAELAEIEPHAAMKNGPHYINHISVSPSGTYFIFFHLWVTGEGQWGARLFCSEMRSGKLRLLYNGDHVSHYCWLSDERFVVTARVAPRWVRYCVYHVRTGFEGMLGPDVLTKDGHPSFLGDGETMITDTYPDRMRDQHLLAFNTQTNELKGLDRFYLPMEFREEMRCDLHPRVSPSGRFLSTDVGWRGRRATQVHDLSNIKFCS